MVDILVRNVDPATAERLKQKAKAEGKSVSEIAREALTAAARPSKQELWAKAERLRKEIGQVSGDSTALIREDRDSR